MPKTLAGQKDSSLPQKLWAGAPLSCCKCQFKSVCMIPVLIIKLDNELVFSSLLSETRLTGLWVKTADMRSSSPAHTRSLRALHSSSLPQRYKKSDSSYTFRWWWKTIIQIFSTDSTGVFSFHGTPFPPCYREECFTFLFYSSTFT